MYTEDTGPKFGFYRDISNITTFMKSFYDEVNVPPKAIEYIEAVGSGNFYTHIFHLYEIDQILL